MIRWCDGTGGEGVKRRDDPRPIFAGRLMAVNRTGPALIKGYAN